MSLRVARLFCGMAKLDLAPIINISRVSMSNSVRIVEVGPRDGLQNISNLVPTTTKLALISRLQQTGLQNIEITSIVSPRAVPQLSDNREVLGNADIQALFRSSSLRVPVLTPNLRGFEVAREHGVKEVAVFVSASEGFSKANINCSVQEGLDRARVVAEAASKHGISIRGQVALFYYHIKTVRD
jgi:hydroxymethylglutaryl-CoA lyase